MSPAKRFFLENKMLRLSVMYALAIAALFWVFHDINIPVLKKDILHINWWLVALGMVVDLGRYVSQSIRWRFLLQPIGKIGIKKTLQALYAGIFINLILPFRVGEIVRAYLASCFSGIRFASVASSLIVEYFIDGLWFALFILVIAFFIPLPPQVMATARIFGVLIFVIVCLFTFVVFTKNNIPLFKNATWKPLALIVTFLNNIKKSMRVIGTSKLFLLAFSISSLNLVFHILAFWIIMMAYGISLSLVSAAAVLLFVFVGLIIPNAPSNVGSFQFLCVLGLMAFGVDKTVASGFSVLVFVALTAPQLGIGLLAFSQSGQKFYDVKEKINHLKSQM
jgi:uncharacterized protein (TIRG00374 family)